MRIPNLAHSKDLTLAHLPALQDFLNIGSFPFFLKRPILSLKEEIKTSQRR